MLGSAGKFLNQNVKAIVNAPLFQRADFDRRRSVLMKAVSQARQFAKFRVMQERAKGPAEARPFACYGGNKKATREGVAFRHFRALLSYELLPPGFVKGASSLSLPPESKPVGELPSIQL